MKKSIKLHDGEYYLSVYNYAYNNRLYLGINDSDGNIVQDLSVNLPEIPILRNQTIALSDSVSNKSIDTLVQLGIITKPIKKIQYNMSSVNLVNVNFEKLKEYDSEGLENYLNNISNQKGEKLNRNFYSSDEIKQLLKQGVNLVYVDYKDKLEIIKYDDIADAIIDINRQKFPTDIKIYNYKSFEDGPIVTTIGPFLNYCNPTVRKDIIARLINLQIENKEVKNYKIIDEELIDDVKILSEELGK